MTETKLMRLERSIVSAEDSAEDAHWLQAEEVVRRLDRGETQAKIAAGWTNLRTGKPYSREHVKFCAKAWRDGSALPERPLWKDAYQAAGGRPDRWSKTREQQAPTTVESARKLVQNMVAKSSPAVIDAVYNETKLALHAPEEDRTPAGRKAGEARGKELAAPIKKVVGAFDAMLVAESLKQAAEELQRAVEDDALTSETMTAIENAYAQFETALLEARFKMEGAQR